MTPIQKKYQELGSENGFLGAPISSEISTPNGLGIYQDFQHGMIYFSPDFGACVMSEAVVQKWKSNDVAKKYLLTDKNVSIRDYLGFPIRDTFKDTCYFERGLILRDGNAGGMAVIFGDIYITYQRHGGVEGWMGLPLFDEFRYDGQVASFQYFKNADIYWKNGLGAFEVHGAIKERYRSLVDLLGYPISDENSILKDGREIGRSSNFESGTIFWSEQTGANEMHGMLLKAYLSSEFGGPAGTLGFPTSDEKKSKNDKFRFNNFQNGVLIFNMSNTTVYKYSNLKVIATRLETDEDDDDLYVKSSTTLTSDIFPRIKVDKDFGEYSNQGTKTLNSDEGFIGDFPLRDGNSIINITMKAWDVDGGLNFGDDEIASFTKSFDIESLWDASASDLSNNNLLTWYNGPDGKFKAEILIQNDSYIVNPSDSENFRKNLFWNIHNPKVPTLEWTTFAETFSDVEEDDSAYFHPFNHIYYQAVYKSSAETGTCFGMCLEAVYALKSRSASREPISQYMYDDQRKHDINIKFGYQLGGSQIDFIAAKFISGKLWDPVNTFHESRDFFNSENYCVICLSEGLSLNGHVVLPYRWDDSNPNEWLIYVANPNSPYFEQQDNNFRDSIIKINPNDNNFVYQHGANKTWTGGKGVFNGGRMFAFPYSELSTEPRTPFWEVMLTILAGSYLIFAGDADVVQIEDGLGGKFYDDAGSENADKLTRVKNLMPIEPMRALDKVFRSSEFSEISKVHTKSIIDLLKENKPKAFILRNKSVKEKMYVDTLTNSGILKNASVHSKFVGHIATSINSEVFAQNITSSNFTHKLNDESISIEQFRAEAGILNLLKNNNLKSSIKGSGTGGYVFGFISGRAKILLSANTEAEQTDLVYLESINLAGQALTFKATEGVINKKIKITLISFDQTRMYELSNISLLAGQTFTLQHNDACKEIIIHNSNQEVNFDLKLFLRSQDEPVLTKLNVNLVPSSVTHFEPTNWLDLENQVQNPNKEIKVDVYESLGGNILSSKVI